MQDNGRNKFKGLRRLNALGLALIMLMSMLPGTGLAQEYPYETQAAQGVNMRRSPSGSSVVLERIKAGDSVIVLGESGDYYQITFNERTGYAMKKYIDGKAPASSAPQPASSASLQGTVTGYPYQTTTNDTVNMRKSPSTSAKLIQRIPKNAVITVLERDSGFLKVFYKDEEGYVAAGYVNELAFTTPVPTAAPMSTPGLSSSYIALQSGSTGAEVRALQQAMIELGFLSGTADGIFGSGTQSAVKAFQAMNGHPQTGVADGNLQALLYDGKPKNAKGTKTEVMTLAPIAGVTMRLNNTGDAVSVLQTRLRELGYLTATASGVYDKETMAAVKAFQKKNGLTADGLAGTNTYAALYSPTALGPTAEGTYQPAPSPTPMPTFNIPAVAVKYGSSGEEAGTSERTCGRAGTGLFPDTTRW